MIMSDFRMLKKTWQHNFSKWFRIKLSISTYLISFVLKREEDLLKVKFNKKRLRTQRCKRFEFDIKNVKYDLLK